MGTQSLCVGVEHILVARRALGAARRQLSAVLLYSSHLDEDPSSSSLISPGGGLADELSPHAERLPDGELASLFALRADVKTPLSDRVDCWFGSFPSPESGAAYLPTVEPSMVAVLT